MEQVNNLRICVCLHQLTLRENIIKVIVTGGGHIFQATQIERLYKVITRSFHQGRAVRKFPGKHIGKVDTQLGFTRTFRHGDREKVQLPLKHFLICVYIPFQVMTAGLIELLIKRLAKLHCLQVIIKEMRRTKK